MCGLQARPYDPGRGTGGAGESTRRQDAHVRPARGRRRDARSRLPRNPGQPADPPPGHRDLRAPRRPRGRLRPARVRPLRPAARALACGALLGDRVLRVGALVTPAPSDSPDFDFFKDLAEINVKEFGAALEGPAAIEAYLQPFADELLRDPDAVIEEIAAELPEVDRAIVSRPDVRAVLRESFAEGVRQSVRGWADDDLAFAKPWGFEPEDVEAEVRLWQGELDVLAPRRHGEYVASRLPNARFELLECGGHFLDEVWAIVLDL